MFKIQTELDKTKDHGYIIGVTHNGARFNQNGLDFDLQGMRLTPLTSEEQEAADAFQALEEKRAQAEAKLVVATESVKAVATKEVADAVANAPEKEVDPETPDFDSGWTKGMLINHAESMFKVSLDPKALHSTLVTQVKALYS